MRASKGYRFLAGAAAVLAVTVAVLAAGQQSDKPAGYYTEEQANKGSSTFEAKCQTCHGADLLGGVAPPLAGPNFMMIWRKRTTNDLFTRIHEGMPIDNPGTLGYDEVCEVVAFILQTNGAPAGTKEFEPSTTVGIGVATASGGTGQPKATPPDGQAQTATPSKEKETAPAGGEKQTAPSNPPSQGSSPKQAQPSKESGAKPSSGENK